ncbi:MAG: hypothetical protein JNJ51_05395 [Methylobacillus glycogenes]|nr:hypothetical protein [Methylobacillus glycogenes]
MADQLTTRQQAYEQFLKDVATHEMTVLRNDGVNRHIRFRRPNTNTCYFDLITWSGHLCYTGDMGTFVFQRLEDMFEFFRTDRKYADKASCTLGINPGYWAEKLIAISTFVGHKEKSEDKFRAAIERQLDSWGANAELREEVQDEVYSELENYGVDAAMIAAHKFRYEATSKMDRYFEFEMCEFSCDDYTFHMYWCFYALAWGILKFDEQFPPVQAAA